MKSSVPQQNEVVKDLKGLCKNVIKTITGWGG